MASPSKSLPEIAHVNGSVLPVPISEPLVKKNVQGSERTLRSGTEVSGQPLSTKAGALDRRNSAGLYAHILEPGTPDNSTSVQQAGKTDIVHQPFFIGIAGGTASGKTTVCERIMQALGNQRVVMLSIDEFYRDLTPEECANISQVDFDSPAAFDVASMVDCLDTLKAGDAVEVPVYDFIASKRCSDRVRHIYPADVVVVEGILVFHIPLILERLNMKIFVDTDDDVRLARRVQRDTVQRGRDVEGVLAQYTRFVKPAFERYVSPSKRNADVIIPWGQDNHVAVDLIAQHILTKIVLKDLRRIYSTLHIMPATMQTRGLSTMLRCRNTSRHDFVFYADRLMRLVVESALGLLPFSETIVTTPTGDLYSGVRFANNLCGISVIRSGEAMENALRACCSGIKIGKILIHRNASATGDIAYENLPADVANRHVLLMDPILITGGTLARCLDVLIKRKGVSQSRIVLVTLMAAPQGIQRICTFYPNVRIITGEIDPGASIDSTSRPGIGDFGDRYFGTGDSGRDEDPGLLPAAVAA